MSCFICSAKHINTIVSWAAQNMTMRVKLDGTFRHVPVAGSEQSLVSLLYRENVRAFNAMYKERRRTSGIWFERQTLQGVTPVEIIKLIDSLMYQCDGLKGWEASEAYVNLNHFRNAAIRQLPGYSNAPWSL